MYLPSPVSKPTTCVNQKMIETNANTKKRFASRFIFLLNHNNKEKLSTIIIAPIKTGSKALIWKL